MEKNKITKNKFFNYSIFLFFLIIISVLVFFLFSGDKSGEANKNITKEKSERLPEKIGKFNELSQYNNKEINLSSTDSSLEGIAFLEYVEELHWFKLTVNLYLDYDLRLNPVCFSGKDCRSGDNYNYVAGFNSKDLNREFIGRLYPNFCEEKYSFESNKLAPILNATCYQAVKGDARTSSFFFSGQATYDTFEDVQKALVSFRISDSENYTIRSYEDGVLKELIDTKASLENGTIKTFGLNFDLK